MSDAVKSYPVIPPWKEIVEHMQGKGLRRFVDTILRVIPSRDRSRRILILQSDSGFYKVEYEELHVYDAEEWAYLWNILNRYPAWWEPVQSSLNTVSFYGTMEDAVKAIQESPEYKTHFV